MCEKKPNKDEYCPYLIIGFTTKKPLCNLDDSICEEIELYEKVSMALDK